MTGLASFLAQPEALSSRLKVGSLEPIKLQRQVEAMAGNAESTLSVEGVGALQTRIRQAAAAQGLDQLRGRDIREACKVFVQGPHPLISDIATADAVVEEVERTQRRSAVLALVGTYIDGFGKTDAFDLFATRLRGLILRWNGRPIDPWLHLHQTFNLFQPSKAPTKIAAAVLSSDQSPARVLAAFGLDTDIRRRGGLGEATFTAAAEAVAEKRGDQVVQLQKRLAEWSTDANQRFAFPKAFLSAARGFLTPWVGADPPPSHRSFLIETLEAFGGGDPRTKPAAWSIVRDNAPDEYRLLMRWLTRASVFQFFDIVDRSLANDPAGKTMWAYRRKFWTAYLLGEEGAPQIEQAWVAFGSDGAQLARRAAKENNEAGLTAFGAQEDKSSVHAALIMRIGDLTIVDWSHNAKCNFWRKGAARSPELYKSRYPKGTLYSAIEQLSHSAPGSYNWQKTFAALIEGRHFYSERRSWRPKFA
jgi:hypothetical protein